MPNECQVANFRHSVRRLSFVFPDILLLYLFILPSIFIAISGLLHGVSKLGLVLASLPFGDWQSVTEELGKDPPVA